MAYNYNWNNGFRIPMAIIRNNCCYFATAVMVFYLADGFTVLSDIESYENSPLIDWKEFMDELLAKIHEGEYGKPKIAYKIPLAKVQLFKLKKANDNILEDLISDIDGETLDIPVL